MFFDVIFPYFFVCNGRADGNHPIVLFSDISVRPDENFGLSFWCTSDVSVSCWILPSVFVLSNQ